ncbi:prepilin-type N-terminal cleavage/methylation domain-containing protein [Neobacillus sp. SAB-20_R2A]|uniref:prepilin-type N-terminal cleavage/methylation domain-containing protein n=1 Tax=Neobacillus sp. SAB-20_R2A TaxID=3120519 RepID=UPI003C6E8EBB
MNKYRKTSFSPANSENGMTLVEILVSIIILSIIIISLLSMFVQSSQTNRVSKNMMDATYLAESQMEEINNMNTSTDSPSIDNLSSQLLAKGYAQDSSCSYCYSMPKNGHYVFVQLKNVSAELGNVMVRIYKDDKKTSQEAQMELVISWKK